MILGAEDWREVDDGVGIFDPVEWREAITSFL